MKDNVGVAEKLKDMAKESRAEAVASVRFECVEEAYDKEGLVPAELVHHHPRDGL